MDKQEEQFVHLVSCEDSLNSAWRTLHQIKESQPHPLVGPAFQFALVEYAKPYLTSRGTAGRHKLNDRHVPSAHRDLHKRLIKTRNQILAHSDLTVMEAKLHVAKTSLGARALIAQNVIHGAMELTNIESIIDLIEQTLVSLYAERTAIEQQLPVTMGAV